MAAQLGALVSLAPHLVRARVRGRVVRVRVVWVRVRARARARARVRVLGAHVAASAAHAQVGAVQAGQPVQPDVLEDEVRVRVRVRP